MAITIAATIQTTDTTMIIILEEMILKLEQVTTIVDDLIIIITVGEKPFKVQVSYWYIVFCLVFVQGRKSTLHGFEKSHQRYLHSRKLHSP